MSLVEMIKTAKMAVEVCAAVKADENVCIVTDTAKFPIAEVLASAANALGAETVVTMMTPRKMHGNEPPKVVASAMKAADVVFAPTSYSITHTNARIEASRCGARMIIMRGVTEDIMLHGAMTADYRTVRAMTKKVADLLTNASTVKVASEKGTKIEMSVRGRKALALSGFATEPGEFATLPDGEAAIAPIEGSAEGVVVIEHTMDGLGLLKEPVMIEVKRGRVVDIGGGEEARSLQRIIEAADENATNFAEFAIGTNPKARLIGNMAEDKKLLGAVHIAIGDNHTIGGIIDSDIHLDGLILEPTVELDGRLIVERGKLRV